VNLAFVAGKKTDESFCMKEIYAMRRANGDWFALEGHGRLCVPLFLNSHDALMSRLRNFGMQLFEPVALDAQLLKDVAPAGAAGNVDFCLVEDPFASLTRGAHLAHGQLAALMNSPYEQQTVSIDGNGFREATLNHTASK
jgi:hypothetical protein